MVRYMEILKTTSSQVYNRTCFESRFTILIPDFFIMFLYLTLTLFSGIMDLYFLIFLLLEKTTLKQGLLYLPTIVVPGICEFFLRTEKHNCSFLCACFLLLTSTVGFYSLFIFIRFCLEIQSTNKENFPKFSRNFATPLFWMSDKSLSALKIDFWIFSVMRVIPQFFLISIFLWEAVLPSNLFLIGLTIIFVDMIIFSTTIAMTLPIRKRPRVFPTSFCILFNAFCKFMASMCACCLVLAVFGTTYRSVKNYAFFFHFLRQLTWAWPSWHALSARGIGLNAFGFGAFLYFTSLVFSFIYIHPFEGVGKLNYYIFYFIAFLQEIFVIYYFHDPAITCVTGYFSFRVLMIGYLSCFELINILLMCKEKPKTCGVGSYKSLVHEEDDKRNSNYLEPEKPNTQKQSKNSVISETKKKSFTSESDRTSEKAETEKPRKKSTISVTKKKSSASESDKTPKQP